MITNNDLDRIRSVVKEEISWEGKQIRQEFREEITASEERIKKELRKELKSEITASEKRVIREIGDFVSDHLLPEIDEKADKKDLVKLTKRVDRLEASAA